MALEAGTQKRVFSRYVRHHAEQAESVCILIKELEQQYPEASFRAAVCGSGGLNLANTLELPYIQEVVSSALAIHASNSSVRTAIELGGQDAKIIFFSDSDNTAFNISDMRMNGSCAGGTGAFIDEIATLLNIPPESFDSFARAGTNDYEISGRCGVFAKTDIQPLINQGVSREDIAFSSLHALAKQTIGGLAQGLEIKAPVAFLGGPIAFIPTLVDVFAKRLGLSEEDIIIPVSPETSVAYGAALSLELLFADDSAVINATKAEAMLLVKSTSRSKECSGKAQRFFANNEERESFNKRFKAMPIKQSDLLPGSEIRAYLGIDSGSTTTKLALISDEGELIDSFYAPNEGRPIEITTKALVAMRDKYQQAGVALTILGIGTTGYGELLFAKAFNADYHVVETVAHAHAAQTYVPDVSFLLDIGGQVMKAIWLDDGIITEIVMNEACSSGCGSFLESFAASLRIPVQNIASAAFASESPAELGSRCTVFMTSSIVSEQKNGKSPEDIMAGLCRSIVENVFTKVIRMSNLASLGDSIVVQGGTFKNDAVLRAFEQYLGKQVVRAPYPDLMGAIGVALLTKKNTEAHAGLNRTIDSGFIGFDALDDFSFTQEANLVCSQCANHCSRSVVYFSNGSSWVTGNRCARGEVVANAQSQSVKPKSTKQLNQEPDSSSAKVPNLFQIRERLLLQDYDYKKIAPRRKTTIGIPRVLLFWEALPFWKTLFLSLGFDVVLSGSSTRSLYERGLPFVTSDTVCFPAKLVHGHLMDLLDKKVDRIFMPSITTVESENLAKTSESMCAIVKGYPIVIRNSDNPESKGNVSFDSPLFHWYSKADREKQLTAYMQTTYGISAEDTIAAIAEGDTAEQTFKLQLESHGKAVLEAVERDGSFAIVLASRPYQNDSLVNHDIPRLFTEQGIPVLCVDSIPGLNEIDLSKSRLDITNNYHARMLSSALYAAQNPNLYYTQIVSFGCGHDACLTDEINRLMKGMARKTALVLKVDESDAWGSLKTRIRSFIEAINIERQQPKQWVRQELENPYPVKFSKREAKQHVVLVPNASQAFCRLMTAVFRKQGLRAEPLAIGRDEAIKLGKTYVHNDACFPAQILIGEALTALFSGKYDINTTTISMAKYVGCCRLTHYTAMLRKALDEAGFATVPILTNDDVDYHNLHPGFKLSTLSAARIAVVLPMIDILEELLRKIRPYETILGTAEQAFANALNRVIEALEKSGIRGARKGFKQAVKIMNDIAYDRRNLRSQVLIVGEYLLNFHPGANNDIEAYLEQGGFEVTQARMTDVIRKTYFSKQAQIKEYGVVKPLKERLWYEVVDKVFEFGHRVADAIALKHPLYTPATRLPELVKASDQIVHHSFDSGEGVLIPGEILHHAKLGCKSFLILQPFACMPNHVVGRGIIQRLKELHPDIQILPLDYDPDVSVANIENRLQMLIMNARLARELPATS